METKHTPGPWVTNPEGIGECVVGSANRMVCECYEDGETQNGEDCANARLIAAAPELLEALEVGYSFIDYAITKKLAELADNDEETSGKRDGLNAVLDMARAAIAKATEGR